MTAPLDHAPKTERAPFVAMALATWFGAGLSPRAPGTLGSLASLVLWGPLVMLETAWWIRVVAAAAVFAVGTLASNAIVKAKAGTPGGADPQIVVIDEVAGMGVTLALASHGWLSLALGFGLFRLFDIWKPWPVRLADRKIKGGFGVMFDDVLAGLYALGALVLIETYALPALLPKVTP